MEKKLNEIGTKYFNNKLSLSLLDNMFEIISYTKNLEELEQIFKFKQIQEIYLKNQKRVCSLKELLNTPIEDRQDSIKDIIKDIYIITEVGKQLVAEYTFAELIQRIYLDYLHILEIDDSLKYSPDDIFSDLISYLDEDENLEKTNQILACLKCNMTKENYNDYIISAFKKLYKDIDLEIAKKKTDNLKLKFAPYIYIKDEEKKKYLWNLFIKDNKLDNITDIQEIIDDLESIIWKNMDLIGTLDTIYSNCEDILYIYKFCKSLEEIFQDDFIFKDIYFYICEKIEERDFEALNEDILKICEDKIELFTNQNIKNIKEINNHSSDITNICNFIDMREKLDFEQKIIYMELGNDKNLIDDENIYKEANNFIDFINNLDIDNKHKKILKQQFFFHMPCNISKKEIIKILENNLYSLNKIDGLITTYNLYLQIDYDNDFTLFDDEYITEEILKEYENL